MILREYQERGIHQLKYSIGKMKKRCPVLQCSTGSGKTVIAGEIIKMALAKGNKVAFVVPLLALVQQASDHLDEIGIDHGIIQGNHPRTDPNKPVQIISIQTLARRKKKAWPADLFIIDECHIVYKGMVELMKNWSNIPFIGLSATPWTRGLGKIYDDLIIPITIHELIDQGYLVDADAYGPSKPDMTGVKMQAGDYNQKQAAERSDTTELVANIVETWLKLAKGRPTICFATNVAHSKHIAARFKEAGVKAVHIDAYTDSEEREYALAAFKNGEIDVLTSVGVLHTGFDAPNASCAILARPTKSLMLHLQMIGRILRIFSGKERGLILDHAGNIERLGFHTDPTPDKLDMGERKKKETLDEQEEKKEKLPRACPACYAMIPAGEHACPACGTVSGRANTVSEKDGELRKLARANRQATPEEKREFYGMLLHMVELRGYKIGWANHKYREKFGVWPNAYKDAPPIKPTEEFLNWLTSRAIAWGATQRKAANQ